MKLCIWISQKLNVEPTAYLAVLSLLLAKKITEELIKDVLSLGDGVGGENTIYLSATEWPAAHKEGTPPGPKIESPLVSSMQVTSLSKWVPSEQFSTRWSSQITYVLNNTLSFRANKAKMHLCLLMSVFIRKNILGIFEVHQYFSFDTTTSLLD